MTENQVGFLDATALIERSQPANRRGWFWYAAGIFLFIALLATYVGEQSPVLKSLVDVVSMLLMFVIAGVMMFLGSRLAKVHRDEQQRVEAIEESIQLRRWEQAAAMLQQVLGSPMRNPQVRIQALLYLISVLSRYDRFEQAEIVADYLMSNYPLDPGSVYGIKLGRAMSMLRQDHLSDASSALSEIRNMVGSETSAGLSLLNMYRDIKTGHPTEAIEILDKDRKALREQLGTRIADAYAMAARAHDLLGQRELAERRWQDATSLAVPAELIRRYPELTPMANYPSTMIPAEVA